MANMTLWDQYMQGVTGTPMADYTLGSQMQFRPNAGGMTGGLMPLPQTAPMAPPAAAPPPMTPPRPAVPPAPVGAPMQLAGGVQPPSVRESFMQRLLSGPVYQSTGETLIAQPQGAMPMTGAPMAPAMTPMRPQDINWGNPENPADFVRADQALRGLGLLG